MMSKALQMIVSGFWGSAINQIRKVIKIYSKINRVLKDCFILRNRFCCHGISWLCNQTCFHSNKQYHSQPDLKYFIIQSKQKHFFIIHSFLLLENTLLPLPDLYYSILTIECSIKWNNYRNLKTLFHVVNHLWNCLRIFLNYENK